MDGAHLQVCENCKNYGTLTNEPQKPYQSKSREIIRHRPMKIRHKSATPYIPEDFVTEDFPRIIREGRIKHGLNQKELASKINERLSVKNNRITPEKPKGSDNYVCNTLWSRINGRIRPLQRTISGY